MVTGEPRSTPVSSTINFLGNIVFPYSSYSTFLSFCSKMPLNFLDIAGDMISDDKIPECPPLEGKAGLTPMSAVYCSIRGSSRLTTSAIPSWNLEQPSRGEGFSPLRDASIGIGGRSFHSHFPEDLNPPSLSFEYEDWVRANLPRPNTYPDAISRYADFILQSIPYVYETLLCHESKFETAEDLLEWLAQNSVI